jgi:hypothetical protein
MITSNLKEHSLWIGKGVNVRTVDDAMLRGKGDDMKTLPANNGTNSVLLGLITGRSEGTATRLARLGMPAEQIHAPALKKWWRLAVASRHGYYIHGRPPVCVVRAAMLKKT